GPPPPDAARHRGDHCEFGVAAGAVHRRGPEGLGARRLVGGGAVAGQSPGHHQTARRVAGGGDGPALCRGLYAPPGPAATIPAASQLGTGAGGVPPTALGDGSTLEALRKKTQLLRQQEGLVLAGTVMVMVEAFSHRPLWHLYTEDALANDKRFAAAILAALPVGGLLIFDLGFFSFLWFDDFTTTQRFFVTRMREKIAYRTVQVLSQ